MWQIGDVRVTKVPQMTWHLPLWGLVPEATPEACAEVAPGLLPDDGVVEVSLHGLLVESGDRCILVDTCAGDDSRAREMLGKVRQFGSIEDHHEHVGSAIKAAGWSLHDIDTVVNTHLHFDHVGGNIIDGEPAFPSARHVVAGDEWAFWSTNQDDAAYASVDDGVRPLVEQGLVDLVDPDHRLTDEVWLEPTPGHTPGHVSVRISSGGDEGVITGDLVHHPVELFAPDWAMVADEDAVQASATRRQFVDRYGDGETLVLGTHFAGSSAGRLFASERRWVPA